MSDSIYAGKLFIREYRIDKEIDEKIDEELSALSQFYEDGLSEKVMYIEHRVINAFGVGGDNDGAYVAIEFKVAPIPMI